MTKSENTKEEKAVENPQMKKDLKTTKNNSSRQNECLCTMENLSIDNFCVLLAMVIVKAARKRLEHLPEKEPISNELSFLKFLEIETELMWHINPKNMMRGEQSFILSLFSTSCALVNSLIQPLHKEHSTINDFSLTKNDVSEKSNSGSKENDSIIKESLPISSDSEENASSSEARSSNILISCVGRRSKRKKKKKSTGKSESGETKFKENDEKDAEDRLDNVAKHDEKENKNALSTSPSSIDDEKCVLQRFPNDTQTFLGMKVTNDVKLDFVRVLIPNEQSGTISASSIPVINKCQKVNMGTRVRDVMAVVSFKQKVTNPHEYAVYLLTFESKNAMLKNEEENTALEDVFQGNFLHNKILSHTPNSHFENVI